MQMALNTETAAKLAGEKALRLAQDKLAGATAQLQAAGKEADRRLAHSTISNEWSVCGLVVTEWQGS